MMMTAARARPVEAEMDSNRIEDASVVVLSDGRAGHENQSIGVVEMLGVKDPEVFTLEKKITSRWLGWLPASMVFANYGKILHELRRMGERGPVAVVGAGYQVSRVLKAYRKDYTKLFTVVLMKPAGKAADYDVVAVPQHSRIAKAVNVVSTLGPANRITKARLDTESDRWKKRLGHVPNPRVAVMIGGSSRHSEMSKAAVQEMVLALIEIARKKELGLLVTTSRRTGAEASEAARVLLEKSGVKHFFWSPEDPSQRDNPYLAYLALSQAVVVTADSASMVCEAASSGRPVYLWGEPKKVAGKFKELFAGLIKQGRAKWWDGHLNLRPAAAGLMDTLMIAGFVRARWSKRG